MGYSDYDWESSRISRELAEQRRLARIEKRDEEDGWTQHELLLIQAEKAKKELEGLASQEEKQKLEIEVLKKKKKHYDNLEEEGKLQSQKQILELQLLEKQKKYYEELESDKKLRLKREKLEMEVLEKEKELYDVLIKKVSDKKENQPGMNELVLYMLLKDKKGKEKIK